MVTARYAQVAPEDLADMLPRAHPRTKVATAPLKRTTQEPLRHQGATPVQSARPPRYDFVRT